MIKAILRTLVYADLFNYPLTAEEIHRYLIGYWAAPATIKDFLQGGLEPEFLQQTEQYYTLSGREELISQRKQKELISARLWPNAMNYGGLIASLPFVQMVAVTGSLAMNNSDENGDIDYLIVTTPGRLWLCRLLVLVVVRLASLRGIRLCPNYFISSQALAFPDRTLYAAHEIAQMVPVTGLEVYQQIRARNAWIKDFLPNAEGAPAPMLEVSGNKSTMGIRSLLEPILRTSLGSWIEQWEMNRKIRKLSRDPNNSPEAYFSADVCKGHFNRHSQRTEINLDERLQHLAWELNHE